MDWYKLFTELGTTLGIAIVIAAASVFILRRVIELTFAKDLERFKSDLGREAISFKTTFERLHGERFQVIKESFQRLSDVEESFQSLINPWQPAGEKPEKEKAQIAAEQYNNLRRYFRRNEIFFDAQLEKEFNGVLDKLLEVWRKFEKREYRADGSSYRDVESWSEAWEQVRKDIPVLKDGLKNEFRTRLGVEAVPPAPPPL